MRMRERGLLVIAAVPFVIGAAVGSGAAEAPQGNVLFSFTDDRIIESSGLVARDGLVVTVNDSGDSARIFTVDARTGDTVGVTSWPGEAEDVEALAPAGPGEVWVGDIGDNAGARDAVTVTRVPYGRGDREADVASYDLVYPDGPHDAETLLVQPRSGRLYVVVKEFVGRLYAAPEHLSADQPNRLTPADDVLGTATDGAFFPDGRHLVVRNYAQAAIYTWPGLEQVAMLDLPPQPQGEGVAVTPRGELLVSSEGAHSEVLRVELPASLRAQLAGAAPSDAAPATTGTPAPDPAATATDADTEDEPDAGILLSPWLIGGVGVLIGLVVLLRSLRPR